MADYIACIRSIHLEQVFNEVVQGRAGGGAAKGNVTIYAAEAEGNLSSSIKEKATAVYADAEIDCPRPGNPDARAPKGKETEALPALSAPPSLGLSIRGPQPSEPKSFLEAEHLFETGHIDMACKPLKEYATTASSFAKAAWCYHWRAKGVRDVVTRNSVLRDEIEAWRAARELCATDSECSQSARAHLESAIETLIATSP